MAFANAEIQWTDEQLRRKRAMELLAKADEQVLESAWSDWIDKPPFTAVRGPETGMVMVRGRMGGGGAPFNLGEATVSRATIRLETGEVGFGQALGLSLRKAELSAIFDALAQSDGHRATVEALLDNIERDLLEDDERQRRETAATRVDFFTMVRGDD
jgi:alpha-D-ribose 1-methylphosphonate 5-triphosphate synthase subunit PhnG